MSFMSYCRFEGTATEFTKCLQSLENFDELSESERRYAVTIYDLCEQYIDAFEEWDEWREERESDE